MKIRLKNMKTSFLTDEENKCLFSILGNKRITLSTTLVRLLLSDGPTHLKWEIWCTGIACFVKDYSSRSFFICVYDIVERKLLWTQNMVDVFDCKTPQNLFVQFKADEHSVGLQFVNEEEGQHFAQHIQKIVDKLKEKNDLNSKPLRRSFRDKIQNLLRPPGKSKRLIIVHQTLCKNDSDDGIIYTDVLCKPLAKPKTFESTIVDNLFKPVDKLHPPIPRRFTRL